MSCRTTRGGAVSLRLARQYSGLPDKDMQALFHSLKREGAGLPSPTEEDVKMWRERQRALIAHGNLTDRQKDLAEQDLFRSLNETPDGALFHAWSRIEPRARQEAVIRNIDSAVDLEPPGSQADQYEIGEDGRPAHVWYASYGSNMDRQRFLTYIVGGTPEGTTTAHTGARDTAEPDGDIPIRFPGRMHFAYASQRWDGGGVAFIDNDTAGHVLGRAYRITSEQFDDVVAQENGSTPGLDNETPLNEAIADGKAQLPRRALYGTLVHIGDYQGAPVVTFTSAFTAQEALREGTALDRGKKGDPLTASNEPSPNYMRMIGNGLSETFNMTKHQQADYLRGAGGAEEWPRRLLLHTLRTPAEPPRRRYTATSSRQTSSSSAEVRERAEAAERASGTKQGKPWVMGRPSSGKTCPLCGKPGHTMHECHLLRSNQE